MSGMICGRARELMLEAEIAELKGIGDSELARHVRACTGCHAVATRILHAHSALETGLNELAARPKPRAHWWPRWLPLPLAAAAVLALLILRDSTPPDARTDLVAMRMFRAPPIVTPPAGRQAMVMENPGLTVVWLY